MIDETFAPTGMSVEKLRWARWIATAVTAIAALLALLLLWLYSPVWQTWLFDLSIASVFAAAIYLGSRRLIVAEACREKRGTAAILIGITGMSAALGVFVITLMGPPEGLQKLPALVVVQLLGAVGGLGLGLLTGFFATVIVRFAGAFFRRSTPLLDGAVIGALSGVAGGVIVARLPHLGWWYVVASAALCSLCGTRSAAAFVTLCTTSQPEA